jgi:hypothetical protein
MGFAAGNLNTLANKHGNFGDYSVDGSWVEDVEGKKGWLIRLEGLESGEFTIVDGEIHQSGRHYRAGPNGETMVPASPQIANIGASAKQAINDAIAKWEGEGREKF